ncbi:hypothetical protein BVC71_02925 [Marivivens niveibacter]|uniref:ABC transporter domain-containing protein n=1 Tax=Marivivens niveibacter TaxID=1930667 RepID=A0A251X1J2_9RHOB|nr:hypothetical protein [Marivivens niveibacter]OUD10466.1 hypothetical protein BVC71_02925 [Marivivens niveibacter]
MKPIEIQNATYFVRNSGTVHQILANSTTAADPGWYLLSGSSRLHTIAFLDLLCGKSELQNGFCRIRGNISWPIGRMGVFSSVVTGINAISHFSILYGFDRNFGIEFVKEHLGQYELLWKPIVNWPTQIKLKFSLLLALVADFDIYLIDTNLAFPEDVDFSRNIIGLLRAKAKAKTVLLTPKQTQVVKAICTKAIVVADQKATITDNINEALAINNSKPINIGSINETAEIDADDGLLF